MLSPFFRALLALAPLRRSPYNGDMTENAEMLCDISSLRGKVLFAIASGENLTKLEIKRTTALSMSSVISSVDALAKEGLVDLKREKAARGGKPHSAINLRKENCVCGLSYLSGVLTATALDLKGEVRDCRSLELSAAKDSYAALLALAKESAAAGGRPRALALALNCEERDRLVSSLEDALGIPVFPTGNVAALAYLVYWRGARLPLSVLGVGRGVKCASLEKGKCVISDLGSLRSAAVFTEEGNYRSLLSVARVDRILCEGDYRGHYLAEREGAREIETLGEYSRALASAIADLSDIVDALRAPREIYLFGEYLTEGFVKRIGECAAAGGKIRWIKACREDFACGAATAALIEGVFNPSPQSRK